MGESLTKQINKMLSAQRSRKRWIAIFLCLALLVGLGTTAVFTLNGLAKTHTEQVLDCRFVPPTGEGWADYAAHVHNDDCYDENGKLLCPLPEIRAHIHTEDCYTTGMILICGQEESEGHVHTEDCYGLVRGELICGREESEGHRHTEDCCTQVRGELICTDESEEHEHGDACYAWHDELICGREEADAHTHGDACYAWDEALTCGKEAGEGGHTHGDSCYETRRYLSCGQQGIHTHDASCYSADGVLICGQLQLTEHVHNEACFKTVELTAEEVAEKNEKDDQEDEPFGPSDPEADLENEAIWNALFKDLKLSGDWSRDLVNVARTQLGYAESESNFEVVDGAKKGYTRYGGWYGIPYGDWCAMFISFCLRYAEIPETAFPYDCGCTTWIEALKEREMYASAGEYQPKHGDVVFFDFDYDGRSDHVGLVSDVRDTDGSLVIETIEGNKVETVEQFTYYNNNGILGYGVLPENPNLPAGSTEQQIVFMDGDEESEYPAQSFEERVEGITVHAEAEEGAFPEGTTMSLHMVDAEDILEAVTDAVEGEVYSVQAVDISFFDAAGNEIEPKISIRVTMTPDVPVESDSQTVVHVDREGAAEVVENTETKEEELSFETDAFSIYAIVYTVIEKNVLATDGHNYHITVTCDAESGIPEDADLAVEEILDASELYKEYVSKTENALGSDERVKYARFFDIKIVKDGQEIQPNGTVNVRIELADDLTEDVKAVHFEHLADKIEAAVILNTSLEEAVDLTSAVAFETDGFSVFGVVMTETIETTFLTANGKTLAISVTFNGREELPKGAVLDVSEVTYADNPELYAQRNERLAGVLLEQYGNVAITDVRYLNISIMIPDETAGEGEPAWKEYEPVYPVEVKIRYTEPMDTANPGEYEDYNDGSPKVTPDIGNHIVGVHYTENGAEILDTDDTNTGAGVSETVVRSDGFSEYDFAYIYEYEIIDTDYDYEPSPIGEMTPNLTSLTSMLKASAGESLRSAGDTPAHSKTLGDNGDGTNKLSLTITGDADTDSNTASNANVIIVFDTSNSMINYYVPMEYGARGSNNDDGSNSFVLYKDTRGTEAEDGYTGKVYSRTSTGNWWNPSYTYTEYTGQRYSKTIRRADAAEKVLYDFTHALFAYKNADDPSTPGVDESQNIQAALITFNKSATTVQNWTSTETDITNRVSSTGAGGSKKLGNDSGTNWEDALRAAQTMVNGADNDPTFVVFITDGQPTQWHGSPTNQYDTTGQGYEEAMDEARDLQVACAASGTDSHGALFGIYAYGTEADYLDDLMYYAYTGTARTASEDTSPADGYYNAADSASLTEAVNDIFSKIVNTLGVTAVSISDGTTSQVQTTSGEISHLLEVDTASYEYWLSFNTVDSKFLMKDLVTGEDVEYTVSSSGNNVTISWSKGGTNYSETYEGTFNAGTARIKWTQGASFYNYAPPTASFTDPSVNWDLSSVGTLLDGVTYEVTFDVYPSQYTLDLIADLKNGKVQYEDLDANVRQYLIKNGNEYELKTNTSASLTYTDSRTDDGPQTEPYTNPDPVSTSAVQSLAVSKKWENDLDGRQAQPITLEVTRDGTERYQVTVSDPTWSASTFVSIGIMTVHNGVVSVKTSGHDFSFAEAQDLAYYWDIDVPTVHPMKINGTDTILIQVKEDDIPTAMTSLSSPSVYTSGGVTYYKMYHNGADRYYKVDSAAASLTATNSRRSTLNVTKTVTGNNAPADALFDYTIQVNDAYNEDLWFSIWDGTRYVTNTDEVTYISGATAGVDSSTGALTGFYYAPSGTQISFKLEAGWNLRFINLPAGTTYEVTESDTMPDECFNFESVVGDREYYVYSEGSETPTTRHETTGTVTGQKIEGEIANANSVYVVTYTNHYDAASVTVTKQSDISDGTEFEIIATVTQGGVAVASLPTQSDSKVSPVEGHPDQLRITLKSGETASLHLREGQTLRVAETENPAYTVTYSYQLTPDGAEQDGNTIASISNGNAMTVTNTSKKIDICLNKVAKGTSTLLPDAEFKLYRKNSAGAYVTDEGIDAVKADTTLVLTDGTLVISGLPSGDYMLKEITPPSGYIIEHSEIFFTVNVDGSGDIIVTTAGQEAFDSESIGASTTGTNHDTLVIPNTPGETLPAAGGLGTNHFYLLGSILVLLAGTALIFGSAPAHGVSAMLGCRRKEGDGPV